MLDATDRLIINALQGGFPLTERPFEAAGAELGIDEAELIARIERLLSSGVATRFGPMFNADRMGGAFCLCAMTVPAACFDEVASIVNAHAEVAHNYERSHRLNMWFVLATDRASRIDELVKEIAEETALEVHPFPKLAEFFVGLRVEA